MDNEGVVMDSIHHAGIFVYSDFVHIVCLIFLIIMNLIGFCLMGIDKRKAIRHKWRIPEKAFFIVSILSGSLGTLIGMYTFHHKTKHVKFVAGIPVILALQMIAGVWLTARMGVAYL